jgi:hypothetical protein
MSNDSHWITTRIDAVRKRHSLVTEAVSDRLEKLLKEQLSDGQLTSTELTGVAKELIADMVPAPITAQGKQ